MTVKTTGAEFNRFCSDPEFWPDDGGGTWHEYEEMWVDGEEFDDDSVIPDTAVVTISGGIVYGPKWDGNEPSFESYFKRWRKKQMTAWLTVECPRDKVDAIKAAVVAAGGKVK